MDNRPKLPGITPTSLVATLLCLLLVSIIVQYAEVVLLLAFPAEHSLPLPAVWVFIALSMLVAGVWMATRARLLSRPEMLCLCFALLIATPLMTQGFWHRIVAVIASAPRAGDFDKLDAFNDKLWPHGPNLLDGAFKPDALTKAGGVSWADTEYDHGQRATLPVLSNAAPEGVSSLRIRLPLENGDHPALVQNEPYILSVLARAKDLGPATRYYCRLYADGGSDYVEAFATTLPAKITFLHQTGFVRVGAYGVKIPARASGFVDVEFGLTGAGRVELTDPKLFSVGALEGVYKGRAIVSESRYAQLPPSARADLIVKPDNMWSRAGISFLLSGYIPVRDWLVPMVAWGSILVALLLGTAAIGIIMRRQWLDNERYTMPLTRVPIALMGEEDDAGRALPPIWRDPWMWMGFAVAGSWVLMKACAFYNTKLPDPSIRIDLQPLFNDPGWGTMFDHARFEINAIFLALAIFMELNVLISLVVGFWLFRAQGWVGEFTGWKTNPSYPFVFEQTMANYLAYALATIFFTRKYLWHVLRAAAKGDKSASEGEAMSYRAALLLLLLAFVACGLWAWWLGLNIAGMLVFFGFLLLIGFVAAKIRTECGLPWGYFTPQNLALFLTLMGGVTVFGPKAMIFCYAAAFFMGPTVFFLIPGAQLELLELGRRWNVRPRDLMIAITLGILGGTIIGGWVFLSNSYAMGGETMRYDWAFSTKSWYFNSYNGQMSDATSHLLGAQGGEAKPGINPVWGVYAFAAVGTLTLTLLRQWCAGFWFHPIGFVLGPTAAGGLMNYIWGSALTAWAIRLVVLRLGGAATVRHKLQPFFIGVFLGAAIAELLIGVYAGYLHSIGVNVVYTVLTPA